MISEYQFDFARSLDYHICQHCDTNSYLEWYDKLYDDSVCTKCKHSGVKLSYKEYQRRMSNEN